MIEDTVISSQLDYNFYKGEIPDFNLALYSSNAESQPDYLNDINVDYVGDVHIDLSRISRAHLPSKIKDGRKLYLVSTKVEVLLGAKEGVLRFRVKVGNKIVGEQDVEFSKN